MLFLFVLIWSDFLRKGLTNAKQNTLSIGNMSEISQNNKEGAAYI